MLERMYGKWERSVGAFVIPYPQAQRTGALRKIIRVSPEMQKLYHLIPGLLSSNGKKESQYQDDFWSLDLPLDVVSHIAQLRKSLVDVRTIVN